MDDMKDFHWNISKCVLSCECKGVNKVFMQMDRVETYRMPEQAFWIQAITIQPVPAIPGVDSGTLTMPILTFISLKKKNIMFIIIET